MTRLVHAELLKLRTIRTTRWLLALTAAATALLITAIMLLAGRPGQPTLGGDALRQLALVPEGPLTLAAIVLGIVAMAGGFRHGTATWTFLVTPDRGRVVAAKVVAGALAGAALAAVAVAVTFAIALPWLRAKGVQVTVADADLGARLLGLVATTALHTVLGVGLGALLRNQVVAVAGGLLWMQVVEGLLVGTLRLSDLGRWLPNGAASALTGPDAATLSMWAGGLVFAAYGLVLALAGSRLVVRRDLT
jgi:ABC-2 type transport system permease protein